MGWNKFLFQERVSLFFPEMVHLVLSLKGYEQERANKAHESDKTVLKQ